jgi:hypothetical protein
MPQNLFDILQASAPIGFTGSIGGTGFTGSIGTGFTGSQGTTGFTGSIGDTGFTGSVGFTGSQGTVNGYTGTLTVGTTQPVSPAVNDLWVDTN